MTPSSGTRQKLGTLLVLSTYPIRRPRHGGQLRSAALMVEYEKTFSKVVRTAVFNSSVYSAKEYGQSDIPSPADLTQQIVRTPELEAWLLGDSPFIDDVVRSKITKLLQKLTPDAIVFEQVYLYLGMRNLLKELGLQIPLIYSSHNVEAEMMKEIFTANNISELYGEELARLEGIERELVRTGIGTIAVSNQDAQEFRRWGGTEILVLGNGTSPKGSSRFKRLRVRRVMKQLNITSYALLVASSHQPNVSGFVEVLGTRLGYIPEDSMIFVAGDLCRALYPEVNRTNSTWGHLFWSRVFNWDRVSDSTLSALFSEATCIILPITSGGGSNLKTSEALCSGKPIIATSTAMRGYEDLVSAENVTVTSDYKVFKDSLVLALNDSQKATSISTSRLHWDAQLNGFKDWYFGLRGEK